MSKFLPRRDNINLINTPKYDHILTKEFLNENYVIKKLNRTEIACLVGCSDKPIKRLLLKYGFFPRGRSESKRKYDELFSYENLKDLYVDKKLSASYIGSLYDVDSTTVCRYLRLKGFKINKGNTYTRKYKLLNLEVIDNLVDPDVAYWLGFIAADGNIIYIGNTSTLKIKLSSKDREHLQAFKKTFQLDNIIEDRVSPSGKDRKLFPDSTVRLTQIGLAEALSKWNIIPNKSLILRLPRCMSRNMLKHYIRGYFDGDGCVIFNKRRGSSNNYRDYDVFFSSGSVLFLQDLKIALEDFNIKTNIVHKGAMRVSRGSFEDIYKLFYEEGGHHLLRKKHKFDKICEYLDLDVI